MRKLSLILAVVLSLVPKLSFASTLSTRASVLHLASLLSVAKHRKSGNLWYREARAIEVLLFRQKLIQEALAKNEDFDFKFNSVQKIHIEAATHTFSYQSPQIDISIVDQSSDSDPSLDYSVTQKIIFGIKKTPELGTISMDGVTDAALDELERSLYDQTEKSRGYEKQPLIDKYNSLKQAKIEDTQQEGEKLLSAQAVTEKTELRLDVKEKWAEKGSLEHSKWEYAPIKLVSWPIQKIFYDIPAMATGLVTESVSRSPLDNIGGTWDEVRGAGKLTRNAILDMGNGILHPKYASFLDGLLELMDASLKIGNAVLGVAKTGISVVAYPIFRAVGGKKSHRVALRGKRAVLLLVDSDTGSDIGSSISDTYGQTIVESKLKSISDYYCIRSNADHNSVVECLKNIPDNVQYLDIVSLQHTGGVDESEDYMRLAVTMKNIKPELLLSIGCYDDPSTFVDGENSLGQSKSSWAIHYYLANMLEKRLRGMPSQQAANQAFGEGFLLNAVNPVSWGGVLAIGIGMEDKITDGYMGSKPSLVTSDQLVVNTIELANLGWTTFYEHGETAVEHRKKLHEFELKVETLLSQGQITLKKKSLKLLRESEAKLAALI